MLGLLGSPVGAALCMGAALFISAPATAQQPSFDCGKASTAVERAICASTTLSTLDRDLATAYSDRRNALSKSGRDQLLSEQRNWISIRDRCGADVNCLASAMTSRISALSQSATKSPTITTSYSGRWQPYGREATFHSAMTLTPDRLSYDDGLIYNLEQVRPESSVYRVQTLRGEGPEGVNGATHMAFIVHDGLLQIHMYSSRSDPTDPPPMTVGTMGQVQKGRFSVGFYSR